MKKLIVVVGLVSFLSSQAMEVIPANHQPTKRLNRFMRDCARHNEPVKVDTASFLAMLHEVMRNEPPQSGIRSALKEKIQKHTIVLTPHADFVSVSVCDLYCCLLPSMYYSGSVLKTENNTYYPVKIGQRWLYFALCEQESSGLLASRYEAYKLIEMDGKNTIAALDKKVMIEEIEQSL